MGNYLQWEECVFAMTGRELQLAKNPAGILEAHLRPVAHALADRIVPKASGVGHAICIVQVMTFEDEDNPITGLERLREANRQR